MHQHLRASRDGTVEFHSDAGKWTVDLLDLNTPKRVQKKLFYIRVYLDTKRQVVRYEKLLTKIASIIEDRNVDTPQNIESLYERTLTEYEELVSSLNFLENGSS
ncbi:hypothetical protein A3196_06260 [Candidatus Thiodiazotropha endoloripes]|uniref:Uncharacterized protein n=2 Tax=Candidatus Thiodiazotropha endoloripes TaxID=1818881 RepID=A0A1E2UNT0_9GAMM|nr:hypothetical protein A3196_06260 [Candidatus Thiodiazotropha endoloripes]